MQFWFAGTLLLETHIMYVKIAIGNWQTTVQVKTAKS